jgi:hypothetical protein
MKSIPRWVGRVCDLWVGWQPACEYAAEDGVVDGAKSTPRLSSSKKGSKFALSNVLCPALTYPPARSAPEAMQRVSLPPPSSARSRSLRVAFLGAPLSIETRNAGSAFPPLPFPTEQRSAKVPADRRSDAQYFCPFHQRPRVRTQILNADFVTRNPCDSPRVPARTFRSTHSPTTGRSGLLLLYYVRRLAPTRELLIRELATRELVTHELVARCQLALRPRSAAPDADNATMIPVGSQL